MRQVTIMYIWSMNRQSTYSWEEVWHVGEINISVKQRQRVRKRNKHRRNNNGKKIMIDIKEKRAGAMHKGSTQQGRMY